MDLYSIYISAHPKIPKLFYLVQQVTPNPERTLHPFLTENPAGDHLSMKPTKLHHLEKERQDAETTDTLRLLAAPRKFCP